MFYGSRHSMKFYERRWHFEYRTKIYAAIYVNHNNVDTNPRPVMLVMDSWTNGLGFLKLEPFRLFNVSTEIT